MDRRETIGRVEQPRIMFVHLDCVFCSPDSHRYCGCRGLCQLHYGIWEEGQRRVAPFDFEEVGGS